jgi:prepilin-type N-terminal cleavage/methylation domain-containing protein
MTGRGPIARRGEAGLTLLETLVAAVIMGIVASIAVMALLEGNKALGESSTRTTVDATAASLMNRIVADLRQTGPDVNSQGIVTGSSLSLAKGANATTISFRKEDHYDQNAQAIVWGPLVTYSFVPAGPPVYPAAELDANGIDDNGNGLVDEGYVTRSEGGSSAIAIATNVLCSSIPNIDGITWTTTPVGAVAMSLLGSSMYSQGFRFERGVSPYVDQITVTVTVGGVLPDGTVYTRQLREIVCLRL